MYEYKCHVTKVIDGDTIDVILDLGFDIFHGCRVRLYGIDTPESRTRDLEEKARGLLSKKFLIEALLDKDTVIKTHKKDSKGKFGRVLGEVWADTININEKMVEKGLAVRNYGQSKEDVKAAHSANAIILKERGVYEEKEAKSKK